MSLETSKTEMQREERNEKRQNRLSKNYGKMTQGVTCIMGILEGEERKEERNYLQ